MGVCEGMLLWVCVVVSRFHGSRPITNYILKYQSLCLILYWSTQVCLSQAPTVSNPQLMLHGAFCAILAGSRTISSASARNRTLVSKGCSPEPLLTTPLPYSLSQGGYKKTRNRIPRVKPSPTDGTVEEVNNNRLWYYRSQQTLGRFAEFSFVFKDPFIVMSLEGIVKEVNKAAGWAWNQFPGLPHKEYERVSKFCHNFHHLEFRGIVEIWWNCHTLERWCQFFLWLREI